MAQTNYTLFTVLVVCECRVDSDYVLLRKIPLAIFGPQLAISHN